MGKGEGFEQKREGKGNGREKGTLPGYLTLEVSMLMLLLIPMLTAMILAGFRVHDAAYLQGAASEAAAMGSNLLQYPDGAARLQSVKEKRLAGRLFWTREVRGDVHSGRNSVSASFEGTFRLPALTESLLDGRLSRVRGKWSRSILHPADLIRKMRGVKYMIDSAGTKEK